VNANNEQVGGNHYKKGGEEHWDRAWRLRYDCYQYIITKWIERWREKGGLQDLYKARHAINKYIEVVERETNFKLASDADLKNPGRSKPPAEDGDAGPGYVNQDR
jgi:hypothetical protein